LKLPLLLTQFLYKYKRLALPGIGIFTLDPSAEIPDGHSKNLHSIAGIEFKNAVINQPDEDLIQFIQANTGKIKPVAVADLDSYLTLGAEMLNIGKPFFLEGIGTITRQKGSGFDFSPGEYSVVEASNTEKPDKHSKRKSVLEESQFEPQPNNVRKIMLLIALVIGLGVIGWGGYMMYKKNAPEEPRTNMNVVATDTAAVVTDSAKLVSAKDSVIAAAHEAVASTSKSKDTVAYKFIILATYNKERALKRYNQLRSYELKINMYTKDSTFFKVYFTFPAAPRDTVHIKDSLSREYAHSVIIER
jgi:flagellar basal body-associated protein FliL